MAPPVSALLDVFAMFGCYVMGMWTGIAIGKWLKRDEIVRGLDVLVESGRVKFLIKR